jgi:hypothetical protein
VAEHKIFVYPVSGSQAPIGPLTLQEAVKEARRLVVAHPGNAYDVKDDRGARFNRYPDADIEWQQWRRAGLIPMDS